MSRPHTRGSLYRDIYNAAITCGLDFRPKYWHEQTRRTRASPCFGGHFPWPVTFLCVCTQTIVYAFAFTPASIYLNALDWKMKFLFFLLKHKPCICPPLLIKWWNISWKHNPLKRLRWLFLKEWKCWFKDLMSLLRDVETVNTKWRPPRHPHQRHLPPPPPQN